MAFNGVVEADSHEGPAYGLFSAATVKETNEPHWFLGFNVENDDCGYNLDGMPKCHPSNEYNSIFDNSSGDRFFYVAPFGILQTLECDNSVGIKSIDRGALAVKQLSNASEYAVEKELWDGLNAQDDDSPNDNPSRWLSAATDVTPTPGTAIKPLVALGLVEQSFANNNPGVRATIHLSPLMAAVLKNSFKEEDGVLYSKSTGSIVTVNHGSTGQVGPVAGSSATKHWIYATGPVHVMLGGEELITDSLSSAVDTEDNSTIFTAERPAAVWFEGCGWYGALADSTL